LVSKNASNQQEPKIPTIDKNILRHIATITESDLKKKINNLQDDGEFWDYTSAMGSHRISPAQIDLYFLPHRIQAVVHYVRPNDKRLIIS
jgi:hypothetical protein